MLTTNTIECRDCGRADFSSRRALGAHRRRAHGIAGATPAERKRHQRRRPCPTPPPARASINADGTLRPPPIPGAHACRCGERFTHRVDLATHRRELDHYDDQET